MRKTVLSAAFVIFASTAIAQEKTSLADLSKKFDSKLSAFDESKGRQFTFDIEISKHVIVNKKSYYRAKSDSVAEFNFLLPKSLAVGDKVGVTATIKGGSWDDRNGRHVYFDPVQIDKEISVATPLFTATEFMNQFLKNPEKEAAAYQGKTIRLTGTFSGGGRSGGQLFRQSVRLPSGPATAILYVNFADVDGKRFSPTSGTAVKIECTVESMNGSTIRVIDAKLVN